MGAERGESGTKVLIIDDDKKLCRLVADYLGPFGYDVSAAHTGPLGLEAVLANEFSAVILDVMLPGMDGFEVLLELRRESDVPVLMLTTRGDETDRIVGLEIGADDYLPKTFSSRELLARLRAVTRRGIVRKTEKDAGPSPIVVGDLRIEPGPRIALLGDKRLDLTPLEFDLLTCLASAAGRVLSRSQIMDMIGGRNYDVFDRSIDVHISALRKKLGDDPRSPRYIKTLRTAGYMLNDPSHGEVR